MEVVWKGRQVGGGMVVFPEKVGFFSQTSASQSPNGTSHDLVFQEPLVSLPKAHPVFGGLQGLRLVPLCFHPNRLERGCQSPDWEGELRSVCSGTRTGYLSLDTSYRGWGQTRVVFQQKGDFISGPVPSLPLSLGPLLGTSGLPPSPA